MVKTSSFLLSCVLIEDVIVIAMVFWGGEGVFGIFSASAPKGECVFDLC